MNYEAIRELAGTMRVRMTDLLALAPTNDPFYADMPSRAEAGEWFADLWHRFGFRHGAHLRRVHYVVISQSPVIAKPNGSPYLNTENDWKYLGIASLAARYRGLIPADAMVDRRNPDPIVNFKARTGPDPAVTISESWPDFTWALPEEPELPDYHVVGFDPDQEYLVEVFVEKSTMNDVLVPLGRRLGFNLVTGVGEMSETAARLTVGRAIEAGKPLRILYVSDFDPAGRSMPVAMARKIEWTIRNIDPSIDVTLDPIVLTPEQCEQYRLPRTPIKETERRAATFEERFGAGATELDALEALHPGELARIVEREVGRYLDPTLAGRVSEAERALQDGLADHRQAVLDLYADEIQSVTGDYEAIRSMLAELEESAGELWRNISTDLRGRTVVVDGLPLPRDADPVEEPLFDGARSYLEQLDAYRRWQRKP